MRLLQLLLAAGTIAYAVVSGHWWFLSFLAFQALSIWSQPDEHRDQLLGRRSKAGKT